MRIEGARILVTGASSGIGAALAPQLAARGATLGIVARRKDRLERVLAECREHTPASQLFAVDLADLDAAEQVVRDAWGAFDGLDCLINNAAMGKRKHLVDLGPGELDQVMRLDFFSPVRMCMTALPLMLEQGSGLLVNVSSMGGRLGIVHEAAYCAAKFALCGWSESARIDLAGTSVDVKLVLPGPIDTEIWETQPGDLPGLYDGPFVSAAECAASIVAALEDDGFEYYAPPTVLEGFDQKEIVVGKTRDVDAFLSMMAELAAGGVV